MTTVLSNKQLFSSLLLKLKQRRVRNVLIGLYVLFILGLSATVKATEVHILPTPESQRVQIAMIQGTAFQSIDGKMFLQTADMNVFELRAEGLDLNRFDGSAVLVTGYEYKHRVGPVLQTSSFNPLQNDDSQLAQAPVVLVFSIEPLQ